MSAFSAFGEWPWRCKRRHEWQKPQMTVFSTASAVSFVIFCSSILLSLLRLVGRKKKTLMSSSSHPLQSPARRRWSPSIVAGRVFLRLGVATGGARWCFDIAKSQSPPAVMGRKKNSASCGDGVNSRKPTIRVAFILPSKRESMKGCDYLILLCGRDHLVQKKCSIINSTMQERIAMIISTNYSLNCHV